MKLGIVRRSAGVFAAAVLGAALAVSVVMPAAAAPSITHEAVLAADNTTATVTVHGGAASAGKWMSLLVLTEDANLAAPAQADIVYLNEVRLDDSGEGTVAFALPSPDLDAYAIAMNAGSGRYIASLDPAGTLPGSGGTPGGGTPGSGGGTVGNGSSGPRGFAARSSISGAAVPVPAVSGTPVRPTPAPTHTASPAPSADPTGAIPADVDSGSAGVLWIVGGGVLLVLVAGLGVWIFRRRAAPTD